MNGKLFQNFSGVIPQHAQVKGSGNTMSNATSDTPFLTLGLYSDSDGSGTVPWLLCLLQGGQVVSVRATDVCIEMTDEMKKSLAEVVLKS